MAARGRNSSNASAEGLLAGEKTPPRNAWLKGTGLRPGARGCRLQVLTTSTLRMNGKPSGPLLVRHQNQKCPVARSVRPNLTRSGQQAALAHSAPTDSPWKPLHSTRVRTGMGCARQKRCQDPGRQRRCLLTMPRYDRRSTPPAPCACLRRGCCHMGQHS